MQDVRFRIRPRDTYSGAESERGRFWLPKTEGVFLRRVYLTTSKAPNQAGRWLDPWEICFLGLLVSARAVVCD